MSDSPPEHAVIIYLKLSDANFDVSEERVGIMDLGEELDGIVEAAGAGEFDGNEFGEGYCRLFLYGQDADRLAETVMPALMRYSPPPQSYLVRRYGPPGSRELRMELGAQRA